MPNNTDKERAELIARQGVAVPALFRRVAGLQRARGMDAAADSALRAARVAELRAYDYAVTREQMRERGEL